MRSMIHRIVLAASCAVLAACASVPSTAVAPAVPAAAPRHADGVDEAFMARIEREARRTNTAVVWFNPPRKRAARPDDRSAPR